MKVLVTILALISFSSVFAADSGCSDGQVTNAEGKSATVRKCTTEAACKNDQGAEAAFNNGVCSPSLVSSTKCPEGVESNKGKGSESAGDTGTTGTAGTGK